MTNNEFDADIAAIENCPDELYEARKKLFEFQQAHKYIFEILYTCERYNEDADKNYAELNRFFLQTANIAIETLRNLDFRVSALELKVKKLEEHAS